MPERLLPQNKKEKKEELESKIDLKIRQIIEIRNLAENCSKLPPKNIRGQFDEILESIKREFSEETLEKLEQCQELDLNLRKYENGSDESYDIRERLDNILTNDDVLFLKRVGDFCDNLVKKREQVLKWQGKYQRDHDKNKYKFYKEFTHSLPGEYRTFRPDQITNINFSGYNIDIIMESEIFESYFGSSVKGSHICDNVVNFYKHIDNEQLLSSINHEHNHNLSETFSGRYLTRENFINLTRIRLQRLHKFIKMNIPQSYIEDVKNLLKNSIQNYFLENESELIADIDRIPKGKITTYYQNMMRVIDLLKDFITKEVGDDFGIKQLMAGAVEEMKKRFIQHFIRITDIFSVVQKENIVDETKAALILFGFSRLDKVIRYQKYLIDKKYPESNQ